MTFALFVAAWSVCMQVAFLVASLLRPQWWRNAPEATVNFSITLAVMCVCFAGVWWFA